MKEDPTRDPASEARDDHASEPRATPETDRVWQRHQGTTAEFFEDILVHARRLERQRDELLEALEFYRKHMLLGYEITDRGRVAESALSVARANFPTS